MIGLINTLNIRQNHFVLLKQLNGQKILISNSYQKDSKRNPQTELQLVVESTYQNSFITM